MSYSHGLMNAGDFEVENTIYHIDRDDVVESSMEDSDNTSTDNDLYLEELQSDKLDLRASTAPARSLTDIEEFRRSGEFRLLERSVICQHQLKKRTDGKYDLDSEEGQAACKHFLNLLEKLCVEYNVTCESRSYRHEFSKAYRVLYKEGRLCYLTEILDSAQEGFPYLWVNGEKYEFTNVVLEAGRKLFIGFCRIQEIIEDVYQRLSEDNTPGLVGQVLAELSLRLQEFDKFWMEFEHTYVKELMQIEGNARKPITDAIEIDKEMISLEVKEKAKGKMVQESTDYRNIREKLVKLICKINSVANTKGKGRDDLAINILEAAEGLTRRMSQNQSKAVRSLAEKIRNSFTTLRSLFRRYDQNIEIVDPQLKNNEDLVEALFNFESSWEKGKTYFLNPKRCSQLVYFSSMIDLLSDKYPRFKDQIECCDAELFLTLPAILVLKCLENEDKGICQHFFPPMYDESENSGLIWKRLKRSYTLGKLASYSDQEYQQLLEVSIIGMPVDNLARSQTLSPKFDNMDSSLHKIKHLAMEIHRHKPVEWNLFLDVALC